MEIPSIPPLVCPHCHTPNKVFVSQRCRNCQLAMMSDWEYKSMIEDIKPIAADLRVKLLDLESGKTTMMASPRIQLLLSQLEPYQEGRPWLKEYLEGVQKSVAPIKEHYQKYRKNLIIFYVILGVLAIIPLVAYLLKADLVMVLLLALPVPGWYFMGLRPFIKKYN